MYVRVCVKDTEKERVALSWSDASFREQWNILLSLLVGFVGMCEREDFSAMRPTPKRCRLHAICLPLHSSTCQTCLFSRCLCMSFSSQPLSSLIAEVKGHRSIDSSAAEVEKLHSDIKNHSELFIFISGPRNCI